MIYRELIGFNILGYRGQEYVNVWYNESHGKSMRISLQDMEDSLSSSYHSVGVKVLVNGVRHRYLDIVYRIEFGRFSIGIEVLDDLLYIPVNKYEIEWYVHDIKTRCTRFCSYVVYKVFYINCIHDMC